MSEYEYESGIVRIRIQEVAGLRQVGFWELTDQPSGHRFLSSVPLADMPLDEALQQACYDVGSGKGTGPVLGAQVIRRLRRNADGRTYFIQQYPAPPAPPAPPKPVAPEPVVGDESEEAKPVRRRRRR